MTGTGTLTTSFCKLYLKDGGPNKNSGRDISVDINTCTKVGNVSIKLTSPSKTYGFTDNGITQGSCTCP